MGSKSELDREAGLEAEGRRRVSMLRGGRGPGRDQRGFPHVPLCPRAMAPPNPRTPVSSTRPPRAQTGARTRHAQSGRDRSWGSLPAGGCAATAAIGSPGHVTPRWRGPDPDGGRGAGFGFDLLKGLLWSLREETWGFPARTPFRMTAQGGLVCLRLYPILSVELHVYRELLGDSG